MDAPMTDIEADILLECRERIDAVANEMKLLANNIEIEPHKYLERKRVVRAFRLCTEMLLAFDNILESMLEQQ
jgi:hypothetical protein